MCQCHHGHSDTQRPRQQLQDMTKKIWPIFKSARPARDIQ
jgi:hypothetical protein